MSESSPLPPSAGPVFLVGSVRSGTTLLRLMLDHHPEISFIYESQFLVERIASNGDFPPLDSYWSYLSAHRSFLGTGFTVDRSLGFPELLDDFLNQRRKRDEKPLIGATVHRYFDRLLHVWPQARFIHIVRDGRDVANSRMALGWAGNGWFGIERWREVEELWDFLRPRLSDDRVHEVRYEDLIRQPDQVLSGICQFFGTQFDSAMYDYTKSSNYGLPDEKLIYQWKRKPESGNTQLAEANAGDLLRKRGYELSGRPIPRVGPLRMLGLRIQNRCSMSLHGLETLGFRLWLSGIVARRLRIKRWIRHVTLQTNAITNRNLR